MTSITKELSNEHVFILKAIDALTKEANAIRTGKEIDNKFFSESIDFIRNYADKFHHAKEEDILFKAMCENEANFHCNPVEQMLFEHKLGRDYVKGMEEGISSKNKEKVIENCLGYCNLLTEHIGKEDGILYPIAEEGFDEKFKKGMKAKFDKVNKENKIKTEKYEKFAKSVEKRA